jgi:pyruvate dehydrogenase E1 component
LRKFFEVDRQQIAFAALRALADADEFPADKLKAAQAKYGIDPKKPPPMRM